MALTLGDVMLWAAVGAGFVGALLSVLIVALVWTAVRVGRER